MSHIRNTGFHPVPYPNSHDVYPDPDTILVWLKIHEKIVYSVCLHWFIILVDWQWGLIIFFQDFGQFIKMKCKN
jgi:hypothetical protein